VPFQDFVNNHQSGSYSKEHTRPQGGVIACQENNKEYRYEYVAGETFLQIQVDGGLDKDQNRQKCDYLLLNTTEKWGITNIPNFHAVFIELKGTDLLKACEQLLVTIKRYAHALINSRLHARVVVSKAHAPKIAGLQTYQKRFRDQNCSFDYQSQSMTEHTGENGNPTRK
jgi:hypothetical protein